MATEGSEPPKTFGDRLKSLIKLRKRLSDDASSDFTGDAERDQLIKSCKCLVALPSLTTWQLH